MRPQQRTAGADAMLFFCCGGGGGTAGALRRCRRMGWDGMGWVLCLVQSRMGDCLALPASLGAHRITAGNEGRGFVGGREKYFYVVEVNVVAR